MRLVLVTSTAVLLLAGCGAGVPPSPSTADRLESSATPELTSSATSTATPSVAPAATPARTDAPASPETPSPPAELPPMAIGEWVATVTDDLTLRAAPGVGAEAKAVLPEGATGTVIAGPELADGYRWYAIMQPDCDPACSTYGWVASAGLDGDPWLLPAEPPCPDAAPSTVESIQARHPQVHLACYGDRDLSLLVYVPSEGEVTRGCEVPYRHDPDWLGPCPTVILFDGPTPVDAQDPVRIFATIHPDLGRCDFGGYSPDSCPLVPFLGTWAQITGHFGDPAASSCVIHPVEGKLPDVAIAAQQLCREQFVVTDVRPAP